jgi:glycosyltransferase involved in cell wall biosynthesis
MKILVLNWQDQLNPQAGGAEIHLREIFRRIVDAGHRVDLLCSGFAGAPRHVSLDGIAVHRVGNRHSYPFVVHRYYSESLAAEKYDVVVEDLNRVPLYTPLWGIGRLVALVHHLFGATAFREVAAPLAAGVWLSEQPLGVVYRNTPFEAVSESTAADLVARGIPKANIRVIYNGVDTAAYTPNQTERATRPLFAYLGRLKRYKRVDFVIRAFAELGIPDASLEIAGSGDDRRRLERLAESLDLAGRVKFLGFIPEEEKLHLLRRAWATVLASPKEGWGISNLETSACGTPVVAANSPGIRESVVDGKTGFLVPGTDVRAMTGAMRRLAESKPLVSEMGTAGRHFAEKFTWEKSAAQTIEHLESVVAGQARSGDD